MLVLTRKRVLSLLLLPLLGGLLVTCGSNSKAKSPTQNNPEEWEIPGWNLVWQDEFSASQVDLTKWEYEVNADGGGNNELQYYTARPENSFIENGHLVIRALKESYTSNGQTREYTSARMRTLQKGDWLYGRIEVRAKLPYGQGLWPAIWMLPTDWVYGGWAASGEIDIMELLGHEPYKVYATLHFGGQWPNNQHSSAGTYELQSGTFAGDFHTFALEWEREEMRWYVDGTHYGTMNQWSSDNQPYPAPFDKRFHLLLNVAVGGNWPGNPDLTTVFPQQMEVDYVRVYEKATP